MIRSKGVGLLVPTSAKLHRPESISKFYGRLLRYGSPIDRRHTYLITDKRAFKTSRFSRMDEFSLHFLCYIILYLCFIEQNLKAMNKSMNRIGEMLEEEGIKQIGPAGKNGKMEMSMNLSLCRIE